MFLLSALLLIGVTSAQLSLPNGAVMPGMPQITRLDVKCAKSGMSVDIEFDIPFNGVIFSKGHFADSGCRFVRKDSQKNIYQFDVPMTGCGTRPASDGDKVGFENILVIQNEEFIQEIWDTARRVQCFWQNRFAKLITFRPFAVDMLEAREIKFNGDDVTCWMDVLIGKGPFGRPVEGIVKIGDPMTLAIYAKDGGTGFDISVSNCVAYDNSDLDNPTTTKIQLSDRNGCVTKPKLFSYFTVTRETGSTGADVIAHASINAFKFPDGMDVFLTCEVELCKDKCDRFCEDPDASNNDALVVRTTTTSTTTTTTTTTPRPTTTTTTTTTTTPKPTTTTTTTTTPKPTTTTTTTTTPRPTTTTTTTTTPKPTTTTTTTTTTPSTTTAFVCTPGSLDPRCPPTCYPGSPDPRCPTTTTPTTTTTTTTTPSTTTAFVCTPGSLDPRCPPTCYPGSPDPRCPSTTTTTTTTTPRTTTTRRATRPPTATAECQGEDDPRCDPNHAFHAWQYVKPNSKRRPYNGQLKTPSNVAFRRKRDVSGNVHENMSSVALLRAFTVVSPADMEFDLNEYLIKNGEAKIHTEVDIPKSSRLEQGSVCLSSTTFGAGLIALVSVLAVSFGTSMYFALRVRKMAKPAHY